MKALMLSSSSNRKMLFRKTSSSISTISATKDMNVQNLFCRDGHRNKRRALIPFQYLHVAPCTRKHHARTRVIAIAIRGGG